MKQELFIELPSLQFFAAGDNNKLSARRYEKQFIDMLSTVYDFKAYFGDFSAGGLEMIDGVKESATAFSIKTSDIAVTVGTYNTNAAIGFGAGTSNTSRFGNRTEIIYTNLDVPYNGTWAIHEGIDRFTVNNDLDAAVADRLALHARAKTSLLDKVASDYLSAQAGKTLALAGYTDAGVKELFDTLSKEYVDLEVDADQVVAKVRPELYNAIIDTQLTSTLKNSMVNIDENNIVKFKGISIVQVPSSKMPTGVAALVYPKSSGKVFLGINTTRTVESEDFDGVALQGAGKHGAFILNDNKPAVVKVTVPTP